MAKAKTMSRIVPVCRSCPMIWAAGSALVPLPAACIMAAPVPASIPTTHTAPREATWVQAARGFSST